jgi:hypothetical protein
MHSRELVDLLADDDAEVLEAHPVDPLVNGRDELDARDRGPVEHIERLGEHDQGDRTPVPDVLVVRVRMAPEKRALVDVQVPIGDAEGQVAERVGCDVDAVGRKTVALHRREGARTTATVLGSETTATGQGNGHPNQPATHCSGVLFQGSASDFFGPDLPPSVAPTDAVQLTIDGFAIIKL